MALDPQRSAHLERSAGPLRHLAACRKLSFA